VVRIILSIVIPLALPTALYLGYVLLVERRRCTDATGGPPQPWWVTAPWPWLISGGTALLAVTLGILAITGGVSPWGAYEPAHMENGRLVGGHLVGGQPVPVQDGSRPAP
jgi:hypothetical protein